jgi:hypothetical protein
MSEGCASVLPQHPDMPARFAELGHAADLGTDRLAGAVQEAVYDGVRKALAQRYASPLVEALAAHPKSRKREERDHG